MERLFVFTDFNWLGKAELVGELCYEKLRGSDSYAFKFDENWLKVHAGIKISEDINNYPGMQYTQPGSDIFGCFSDALPDRWGRLFFLSFFIFLFENQYFMLFLFSFKL